MDTETATTTEKRGRTSMMVSWDIVFTRHFWERYYRIAKFIPRFRLKGLGDFLREQGIFYVSYRSGDVFCSCIGIVFVLKREGNRFVLVTAYPADWRFKYRVALGKIERIHTKELDEKY